MTVSTGNMVLNMYAIPAQAPMRAYLTKERGRQDGERCEVDLQSLTPSCQWQW